MSKRVTVNLPDDVADRLKAIPDGQVSSYVTAALRDRIDHEDRTAATDRMLATAGYTFTDEGLSRMRSRLAGHAARRATGGRAAGQVAA